MGWPCCAAQGAPEEVLQASLQLAGCCACCWWPVIMYLPEHEVDICNKMPLVGARNATGSGGWRLQRGGGCGRARMQRGYRIAMWWGAFGQAAL